MQIQCWPEKKKERYRAFIATYLKKLMNICNLANIKEKDSEREKEKEKRSKDMWFWGLLVIWNF